MCVKKLITAQVACPNKVAGMTQFLYAADAKHISAIPALEDYDADPVANDPLTISGDITFDTVTYPNTGWRPFDVARDSMNLVQELTGDPGQQYVQQTLSWKWFGIEPVYAQALEWTIELGLVFLAQDKAGKYRLVGDKSNPAFLGFNNQYGLVLGDFVGSELTATRASAGLAPFYTGTITLAS